MSRSVSVPSGAVKVFYAVFEGDSDYFSWALEDFQAVAKARYPSLSECDSWLGREDHAVLENSHAYVAVSEYCGLVAVSVVPKEDYAFSESWASNVDLSKAAGAFGDRVNRMGCFSNGECMYSPVEGPAKGELGMGFSSKEGWL